MTTSISGQSFVDRTMTTQTAAAATDPTKVSFTTGDGDKTTEFTPDGNQAAGYKKTTFDGQNLTLPMEQLHNPGVPQKTLDRLQEMATSGGTVTLPDDREASVSQSAGSFKIDVTSYGFGSTTETINVSAADLASGNLSQDVKDLLGDITAGEVYVPKAKPPEPAKPPMPAPASDLEKKMQGAIEDGAVTLPGEVADFTYDISFKDGAYSLTPQDGFAVRTTTFTPEQLAGKAEVPAKDQDLFNQVKAAFP
jgi:hypothetical protein